MFLALTGDRQFWKPDAPLLFLGEWCRRYPEREHWDRAGSRVLPYHWSDPARRNEDYASLLATYEKYLPLVAERLNALHGTSHSLRYWRIVVGQWLGRFIELLFDRLQCVRTAERSGLVSETWVLPARGSWTPRDFTMFVDSCQIDSFNQYLFSFVVRERRSFPLREVSPPGYDLASQGGCLTARNERFPKRLARGAASLFSRRMPSRLNRVAFVGTLLRPGQLLRLQLRLGQLPYYRFSPRRFSLPAVDRARRAVFAGIGGGTELERLLTAILPEQVPAAYVEAYDEDVREARESFPRRPRVIVSSVAHMNDEAFKKWAGHHAENGVPLVGCQHGGGYGAAAIHSYEDHELAIYDRYFSWGWRRPGCGHIVPLPSPKLAVARRRVKPRADGAICWTLNSNPRYAYALQSAPTGPQHLEYIEEQVRFAAALSDRARRAMSLRAYPFELGWHETARIRAVVPGLAPSPPGLPFLSALGRSRLFVGTHNTTTFLETFAADFPTVLFWNPAHCDVRPEARDAYEGLAGAGILHFTPEGAAAKVDSILDDVEGWWKSDRVQAARRRFCERFALTRDTWLQEWAIELKDLMAWAESRK